MLTSFHLKFGISYYLLIYIFTINSTPGTHGKKKKTEQTNKHS